MSTSLFVVGFVGLWICIVAKVIISIYAEKLTEMRFLFYCYLLKILMAVFFIVTVLGIFLGKPSAVNAG